MTRTRVFRRAPFLLAAMTAMLLTVLPVPPAGANHALATPANFTVTAGDGEVTLSWDTVTGADDYNVQHRLQLSPDTPTFNQYRNKTSATISGLTNGQFYVFRIQARDSSNTHTRSAWSDWVTAMPEAMPAKAGSLDASFGTGGVVTTDIGTSSTDTGKAVAVDGNGRIVVAGTSGGDFAAVRYRPGGVLDNSFGADAGGGLLSGKAVTDVASSSKDEAAAVAVLVNGEVVVAGASSENNGDGTFADGDFAVIQYNAFGALDSGFSSDGKVVTDIGSSSDDKANAMVVQSDGKIVVVGTTKEPNGSGGFRDGDFVVARYTTAGALDTDGTSGFGPASGGSRPGYVITDIGSSSEDEALAVAMNGDKIVVAGYSGDDFAVVRYDSAGVPDTTFDTDGKVTTSVTGTNAYGIASAVAMDGDKIVIAGLASDADGADYDFAVLRYTSAGALDTTFSTDGIDTIDFSADGHTGDSNDAKAVAVAPDGKITVAGFSLILGSYLAMARYNADGTLDTSFDTDGKTTLQHNGSTTNGTAMALQPDGRIIVAGTNSSDFGLVRYLGQAEAPTLVSNVAGVEGHSFSQDDSAVAQGFTTGANTAGYVLSSIDVVLFKGLDDTAAGKIRAELWSSANDNPDKRLETLTVPATLPTGRNSLAAPPGTVLAPGTSYHLVIYTTANQSIQLRSLASDDEDPGNAADWRIADMRNWLDDPDPHTSAKSWAISSFAESYAIAVKGSARAAGSGKPIFSATLNPVSVLGAFGCEGFSDGSVECGNAANLSNNDFAYRGADYQIASASHTNHATDSSRQLSFGIAPAAASDAVFKELTLHVGNFVFDVTDATVTHDTANPTTSSAVWSSTGMEWSTSDRIRVMLTVPEVSSNNDLRLLSAATDTSSSGQFSSRLTLVQSDGSTQGFDKDEVSYTATVASRVGYAKLTATVDDSKARSVQVGKAGSLTTVTSGTASHAIALGAHGTETALVVRVTAENGDTQEYTVTVRRQSANANLSGWSATVATATGAFSGLVLPAPSGGATEYSVLVSDPQVTRARLRATVAHSGATLHVRKQGGTWAAVSSGAESGVIALGLGANRIEVRVRAEDTSVEKVYTLTVNVDGTPPAPENLSVTGGARSVSANWTEPAVSVTGYDVQYTTKSADVLDDDAAEARYYEHPRLGRIENHNPSRGWVSLWHGPLGRPAYGRSGLDPATTYRFRVRAYNTHGTGPWAVGSASPGDAARTVVLSASAAEVREGDSVTITATVMHRGRPTPIQEGMDVMLSVHLGTAEEGDVGTAGRISISKYSDRGSVTVPTFRDADGDDETFAVLIRWIPKQSLAKVGHPSIVWVTVAEGDPAPAVPQVLVPELTASGGEGTLHLRWSATTVTGVAGYDVHYKKSSAPDAAATGGDAATGWVDAGHSGTERSMTISGLENWVSYDARVRVAFADGAGRWSDVVSASPEEAVELGEPQAVELAVEVPAARKAGNAEEGDTVTLTATLNEPAPREGATVQFWAYGNTIGGTVSAATVWSDYRMDPPDPGHEVQARVRECIGTRCRTETRTVTSYNRFVTDTIRVEPGRTTATAAVEIQGGGGNEGTEGIGIYATAKVPDADAQLGRRRLKSDTVTVTIHEPGQSPTVSGNQDDEPDQQATAQPTAVTLSLDRTTVAESAGTVTVTATLDAAAPEGGVGGFLTADAASTATADVDYTMPVGVFIAGGQTSATATLTVTDDDIDETDETVVISALFDLGTAFLEHSVTLTITDDDTAAVTVTAASPIAVDEGATATYTVVLGSQPTADVTITPASSDTGAVSVSPASVTFTAATWNTAATFTVTGVADSDTNDETAAVSHAVTSSDANYAAALAATVRVSVADTTPQQNQNQDPPQQNQDPPNRAPTVASPIDDVTLDVGADLELSLAGVFDDPDGDTLTITTDTTDETVANAFAFQQTLTVTAFAQGTVTITVTARDADGNRVSDTFEVTVTAPQTTLTGIAARYDTNGDGAIDGSEYQHVKNDWLTGKITQAQFLELVRIHLKTG